MLKRREKKDWKWGGGVLGGEFIHVCARKDGGFEKGGKRKVKVVDVS